MILLDVYNRKGYNAEEARTMLNLIESKYNWGRQRFTQPQHALNFDIKPLIANCIDIYPNPTQGLINIKYNIENVDNAIIQIVDVSGRVMMRIPVIYSSTEIQANVSALKPGHYIIHLFNKEGQIKSAKFIKL